ncbi:thiamine-phosphate kinase [Psychromonas arctica]|uniref:thiamine-phosphate kinase n=1 Tax=Psychromonas arctica TaxID=168275 RepID=UPI000422C8B2|nr:thiamine-phosphate kinase [Psychromonas arctica]
MSKGEFDIISRYFQRKADLSQDVVIGIGDDCAILDIANGYQLAVTTDSLVSGVHFFENVEPYRLGYKSLAVNLSDLAAMGASAKWVSLAITLPSINEPWLAEFCRGFFALADKYNVQLIGGDTTKGPLSITVSAKGIIKSGQALTRKQAQAGDIICVSGCLGDGALGLAVKLQQLQSDNQHPTLSLHNPQAFIDALELTEPRLDMGELLVGNASSCIDISDGLNQDLSHILKQSQCSAEIWLQDLPFSNAMIGEIKSGTITLSQAWQFAVNGGDDYELLFTISPHKLALLKEQLAIENDVSSLLCFEIGKINAMTATTDAVVDSSTNLSTNLPRHKQPEIIFTHHDQLVTLDNSSWDHFK